MSIREEIKKDWKLYGDYLSFYYNFYDGKYNDKLHEIAPVLYNEYKNNNKSCFKTFWSYIIFHKGDEFDNESIKYLKQQKTE